MEGFGFQWKIWEYGLAQLQNVAPGHVLLAMLFSSIVYHFLASLGRGKQPPGPYQWPILGSIPTLIGTLPHQRITQLAKSENWPIMALKMSSGPAFVVSSTQLAYDVLVKSGDVFANRNVKARNYAATRLWLTKKNEIKAVCCSEYGPEWRISRKIMTTTLSQMKRRLGDGPLQEQLQAIFSDIEGVDCHADGIFVHPVREILWKCVTGYFVRFLYGKQFDLNDSLYGQMLQLNESVSQAVSKGMVLDMLPILKPFMIKYYGTIDSMVQKKMEITEGMLAHRASLGPFTWFACDVALEAVKNGEIDHDDAKRLLDEVILAGVDSSSALMEWSLAEMANHPEVYRKVQAEIDEKVGKENPVTLADVENQLPYVRAVVKECFRLHPPFPLLVPHANSNTAANLSGFEIPKKSTILINFYGMGMDSSNWDNPTMFDPERFIREDVDITGKDPRLIPFGAGRRVCPGQNLALSSIYVIFSQIAQRYDLIIPERRSSVDMREIFGVDLRMKNPLSLCLKKRF